MAFSGNPKKHEIENCGKIIGVKIKTNDLLNSFKSEIKESTKITPGSTQNLKVSQKKQKKKHLIICGFNLFVDLKTSVIKTCKCFWLILILSLLARRSASFFRVNVCLWYFYNLSPCSTAELQCYSAVVKLAIYNSWGKGYSLRNYCILSNAYNLIVIF